jgi:hypothetical protein
MMLSISRVPVRHLVSDERSYEVQYVALIHADEGAWDSLSDEQRQLAYAGYMQLSADAREAGVMVGGNELAPTAVATTVRVEDGQTIVTDGPYAEIKEALGGYYIFDCASFDDAIEWASRIPAAATGAIEVRPVHVEEGATS